MGWFGGTRGASESAAAAQERVTRQYEAQIAEQGRTYAAQVERVDRLVAQQEALVPRVAALVDTAERLLARFDALLRRLEERGGGSAA